MTLKHADKIALWSREWLEWEFNEFVARYNVIPAERVIIGRRPRDMIEPAEMSWGLKNREGRFNSLARGDNVFKYHAKRIQERRCVVPVDGYYEWHRVSDRWTIPFHFQLKSQLPFALAGIYYETEGFLLLTTESNVVVSPILDRMPIMLDGPAVKRWLEPGPISKEQFDSIAVPFSADLMEGYEVSPYVNKASNQGPQCIEPAKVSQFELLKKRGEQLDLL